MKVIKFIPTKSKNFMISHLNHIIRGQNKKPIVYDTYYKKNHVQKPIIIFCHGYKGFKDWGAWNLMGKEFSLNNYFFLKFNFSHNGGTIEDPIDFPDLDAFGNNNFSHELDDFDRVLTCLKNAENYSAEIDLENITLIGHSRGGGSALIKASENPEIKRVITWAGVSDFKIRFNKGTPGFKKWENDGVMYVENSRTKQMMPHFFQFYKDFKKNEARLDVRSAVEKLKIPYLVIHGTNDTSVLPFEGENLFSWNKNNKIERIKGADHVFSARHPWESDKLPDDLKKVIYLSIDFIVAS